MSMGEQEYRPLKFLNGDNEDEKMSMSEQEYRALNSVYGFTEGRFRRIKLPAEITREYVSFIMGCVVEKKLFMPDIFLESDNKFCTMANKALQHCIDNNITDYIEINDTIMHYCASLYKLLGKLDVL